jgi:cytochrome c-type biogenesis protein CcmH
MRFLVPICLAVAACSTSPAPPDPALELATHFIAPCCWRQTLADHDSPLAGELRVELAARLAGGEPPAAIEQRLVARYGERILTHGGAGTEARLMVSAVAGAATLTGLAFVAVLGLRGRRRRGAVAALAPAQPPETDADADRLDDELALVD